MTALYRSKSSDSSSEEEVELEERLGGELLERGHSEVSGACSRVESRDRGALMGE
jgi:hypothetical protein